MARRAGVGSGWWAWPWAEGAGLRLSQSGGAALKRRPREGGREGRACGAALRTKGQRGDSGVAEGSSREPRQPLRSPMAAFPSRAGVARRLPLLLLLGLLPVMPSVASTQCQGQSLQECAQQTGSWTSLWYVWLIMLTVFLLLMCGIGASCVKFCCRRKRPPVQTFPPQAHDLTAIPMDHDSTAHSTVTSYSSVQYPQSIPLPLSFREIDRSLMSPPAYSLYAIELPPSYDEAIKMAKPCIETPMAGQKQDKNASQSVAQEEPSQPQSVPQEEQNQPHLGTEEEQNLPHLEAQEEQNQPQTLPETSSIHPKVEQPDSQLPEASTEGQPEL